MASLSLAPIICKQFEGLTRQQEENAVCRLHQTNDLHKTAERLSEILVKDFELIIDFSVQHLLIDLYSKDTRGLPVILFHWLFFSILLSGYYRLWLYNLNHINLLLHSVVHKKHKKT